MIKIASILLVLFIALFTLDSFAIDFSGSYEGLKCKNKKCIGADTGKGILKGLNLFPEFKYEKRIILYVEHDQDKKKVSIFFPDFDYKFPDMGLVGDSFEGWDDKSGNTKITGDFSRDTIIIKFRRFADQENEAVYYYKVMLTDSELERRETRKVLQEKKKVISVLQDDKAKLQSDVKNLKADIANNIARIDQLNKKIRNLNDELKNTIIQKDEEIAALKSEHKKELAVTKKQAENKLAKTIKKYEDEKEVLLGQLEKCITKPIRIDASFLPMRSQTNKEVVLRTSPSDESKDIETLKDGAVIENLAVVGSNKDWSFIVTEDGLVGYIKTIDIVDLGGDGGDNGNGSIDGEKISITHPKWDKDQYNKKITLKAPGFISITGRINVKAGIIEVQLNDNVVDDVNKNGVFEAFYIIKGGDNEMTLAVVDHNNERHELSFIISAPK